MIPGKSFQLELKSGDLDKQNRISVQIDLEQLNAYQGTATYYVFPDPGKVFSPPDIEAWARSFGHSKFELGFSRTSPAWFAEWLRVVPVDDLLKKFQSQISKGQKTLTLGSSANPSAWQWRDFWSKMAGCGKSEWPQDFRIRKQDIASLEAEGLTYDNLRQRLLDYQILPKEEFENQVYVTVELRNEECLVRTTDGLAHTDQDYSDQSSSRIEVFADVDFLVDGHL